MKKPLNFASVLVIAAALGAWAAWQHAAPADGPAGLFQRAAAETTVR